MPAHEQKEAEFSFKNYFIPFTNAKAIHFLIIIGFLLYCNGLLNGFVGDDFGQVLNNNLIKSIANLPSFYFSYGIQNILFTYYRPIILTYFTVFYTIFGANPFIFHLSQLLFHIASTIVVFLFYRTFFKRYVAFLLSLIFLVHPINSETVLYISYTQDLLFFFLGMLSLLFLTHIRSNKTIFFACLFTLLSLFSKETGVLFIPITIVYGFIFAKKYLREIAISQTTVFIFYFLLRIHAIGLFVKALGSPIGNLPLSQRFVSMPAIVFFYLKTFFFPLTLASSYEWIYTSIDFVHVILPFFIDILFAAVVLSLSFILWKKSSHSLFSRFIFFVFWFFLGLLFHLQIISLDQTVAERWFYFSMVGMLGMIGVLFEAFCVNLKNVFVILFISVILIFLSIRTFVRTFDWRDEFTIASHDIATSQDAWGVENELSYAYFQKGDFKDAKFHAERSIYLYPYKTNYLNLGAAEMSLSDYASAKKAFMESIKLGSSNQAYDNLAFLALTYGDPKASMRFLKNSALATYPTDGNLWLCLTALEYNFGDRVAAKIDIAQAYKYEQNAQVVSVYNAIMNDKPVTIGLTKKL